MAGGDTRKGAKAERTAAPHLPVARVLVEVPLPAHLDRPFDYLLPDRLDGAAVPGCRVRVRFSGKLVDGFLLERRESSDFKGSLLWVERVHSPEPVLSPELLELARAVAARYGGMLSDVVRLAIPPRQAKVEKEAPSEPVPPPARPSGEAWAVYQHGGSFLDAVHAGRTARAVWQALPGEDWPTRLAEAAATAASAGRGAVIVVPDHRDVQRLHAACAELVGDDGVVALVSDLGPAERYRRWLSVLRGRTRVVVGTRAAMFAPVRDLGLAVVWDDGDDLHSYPQVPYPHARDVLTHRAHASGAALVVGGFARTAEAALLVQSGWAREIVAHRDQVRAAAPRVTAIGEDDTQLARDPAARAARLPSVAFEAARAALRAGAPVLVQVPRRGYVPALACGDCRESARCRRCAGPLALPGGTEDGAPKPAACRWCGAAEAAFRCPSCGSRRLRAVAVGAGRTAEELGRAFSGVAVRTSGGGEVLESVPAGPALVVCTPGAEPVAEGGYGAALLLDGRTLLSRPELRASEQALRLWFAAAGMVRPAKDGGRVVVMADSSLQQVQALVRWDPAWFAALELAGREELGFPPAKRVAAVDGTPEAIESLLEVVEMPATGEVLGPVPIGEVDEEGNSERERVLVRVERTEGRALATALHEAQAVRAARKAAELQVRLDPLELL
ncbi:replication restart DNA helicase PriA [Saccharopolyspora erythraea NRRL 2338]|uniref:Probable replication restart protein PriA n=1 Tax=Saccharopolyspora erythraea (strain ATCC 11635 / DSM 40517 / JCM 4748 / NBRC 13426 / NCIMB 8594 / NRRL 2338) TaxID=405948 RepID=A4FBI9_SACEN|nr:primosomal protein N' [Saccharopolyspora erythraea]EQD83044.1 primosome assembly protein PriA [Saccharopolyspora erythraea D]PFG95194.1 replication restart DNA helicase PriA [Saccharopolyspora erythraea NRRL 2338]QRK91856.1 primosomal protein N' [Saccharopolyspora erythraea]CAM01414.1 primosomal protein N' (replication factor Y) [Saccharopolyspora erythraea NRRL 2338]